MAYYAIVKNGVIDNAIVAEPEYIEAHGAELAGDGGECVLLDDASKVNGQRPGPGWRVSVSKGARRFARPAGA